MKKSLAFILALAIVCVASLTAVAQETSGDEAAGTEQAATEEAVAEKAAATESIESTEAVPVTPFGPGLFFAGCTPTCSSLHGTPCTNPGRVTRCYHTCGEPDVCVCQSNFTLDCF